MSLGLTRNVDQSSNERTSQGKVDGTGVMFHWPYAGFKRCEGFEDLHFRIFDCGSSGLASIRPLLASAHRAGGEGGMSFLEAWLIQCHCPQQAFLYNAA